MECRAILSLGALNRASDLVQGGLEPPSLDIIEVHAFRAVDNALLRSRIGYGFDMVGLRL